MSKQFSTAYTNYIEAETKMLSVIAFIETPEEFVKLYQPLLENNNPALNFIDRHYTPLKILDLCIKASAKPAFIQNVFNRYPQIAVNNDLIDEFPEVIVSMLMCLKVPRIPCSDIPTLFEHQSILDTVKDLPLQLMVEQTHWFKETFKHGVPAKLFQLICEEGRLQPYMNDILEHDDQFINKCLSGNYDMIMKVLIDSNMYDLLGDLNDVVKKL